MFQAKQELEKLIFNQYLINLIHQYLGPGYDVELHPGFSIFK